MADTYVGEIRLFAGNFAPAGWLLCHGQLLAISDNETLFTLIGTTYGGDGESTFALPDLRGRVPLHQGNGAVLASQGGAETVTLTVPQVPAHAHPLAASTDVATQTAPAGNVPAQPTAADLYIADTPDAGLAASTVGPTGGSQPHENMQPFLGLNFIISLFGIFPSQT